MASAAENTKIELVTEAFEQLAVAIAQSMILAEKIPTSARAKTAELIAVERSDAREQVAASLRELLKPTLRLVAPDPSRTEGNLMMGCGNS